MVIIRFKSRSNGGFSISQVKTVAVIMQAVGKPMLSGQAIIDFMILSAVALYVIANAFHRHAWCYR